ncbi:RidA family protein [Paraburkholderia sp. A3BS-1L]|uniref:RidA family protein n=1 Tax=Paraburkholderia sp. A3BS-1L TaxID=3028375 RepID=UPI003DA9F3E7
MINPPQNRETYDRFHYSAATRVGDMIWVSGQVGLDPATHTLGQGMEAQSRLAFENLKTVLAAAGATMADIVEIVTFHLDMHGSDIQAFVKIKDEYVPDRYPAWTAVGVTHLVNPDYLVEIRAVAVAHCGAG